MDEDINNLNGVFDSHCHLEQLDNVQANMLVLKCKEKGMKGLITVCARPLDFEKTINISISNPGFVYFSLGFHPLEVIKNKDRISSYFNSIRKIFDYNNSIKPVAIGETGLDYFLVKDEKNKEFSRQVFISFINLALEFNLPIIIHCRDAYEDVINILKEKRVENAVFHYFNSPQHIEEIMDNGWFVSIPYTLSKNKIKSIFEKIDLSKIMLETDSPIKLAEKEFSPLNIGELVVKISESTGIEKKEIIQKTTNNVIQFFSITP